MTSMPLDIIDCHWGNAGISNQNGMPRENVGKP